MHRAPTYANGIVPLQANIGAHFDEPNLCHHQAEYPSM